MRRFLDFTGLGIYDAKIKQVISTGDANALAEAKKYFDDNKSLFEAAGAVKTAQELLQAAIDAVDAKVNGILDGESIDSFADVETELAKYQLAGDYATKEEAQGYANAKDSAIAAAQKAGDDAQANLDAYKVTVGETYETKTDAAAKLAEAKGYTDTEVAKVDAIADKNAEDIATLAGKVATLEASGYDDTEVRGLIQANANAIDLVEADVETIKGDYLKAADKEEVLAAVNTEKERAMGVEGGLEDRIETMEAFWAAAQADGTDSNVIDTLKEIQEYIAGDESGASEMAASIKQNADDIDAVEGRLDVVEDKLDTVAEGAQVNVIETVKVNGEALTITDKAVDVIVPTGALASKDKVAETDLEDALATKINGKAEAQALTDAVAALEGVDAGQETRIAALEAKFGEGEGSVEDLISDAVAGVQAEVDALEGVVEGKADSTVVEGISGKVTTLEGQVSTLQSEMDAVEAVAAAAAKASDLTTLAGRVTVNEGDIATLKSEMDAVEGRLDDAEEAIEGKAAQADLDALVTRVGTAETNIAANTSALAKFVEISETEINSLFA